MAAEKSAANAKLRSTHLSDHHIGFKPTYLTRLDRKFRKKQTKKDHKTNRQTKTTTTDKIKRRTHVAEESWL